MNFEPLWAELEHEAPVAEGGREVRRIHPDSAVDLFLGVELGAAPEKGRRMLELQISSGLAGELTPPRGSRQIVATLRDRGDGRSGLLLELENRGAADLFGALCQDVARATAVAIQEREAVELFLGRFAKWQRMVQQAATGLSGERQRGLFGELVTLRDYLIVARGFDEAVRAWKGPDGAPRDYEIGGVGVEVKTSAANEPQVVTIHGERQLDDAGFERLCLIHHSLELVRDSGENLPGVIAELRALGDGLPESGTLEDRLLQCGYADLHEALYRRTGYVTRRVSQFEVGEGFPRILEGDLPDGVGAVRYSLAIDACRTFETGPDHLLSILGSADA